MANQVDLYDTHYANLEAQAYREIRAETYGEDIGHTSWTTVEECREFFSWLKLGPSSKVLEVACGSGGTSVLMARESGAEVVGVDINEQAVAAASDRARSEELDTKVGFQVANGESSLPFPDRCFDAIYCNDSINHFSDRPAVLSDWCRLLRPSGRLLYTDPIVVTGTLSSEEIATRSSIGFFVFAPIGENERLLAQAGFELIQTDNATENVITVSKRWHDARAKRRDLLVRIEGETGFRGLQDFLSTVHKLSSQGRLSRYVFLARRRR